MDTRGGCNDAISGVPLKVHGPRISGEGDIHRDGYEFDAICWQRLSDPGINWQWKDEFPFVGLLRDFNDAHGRKSDHWRSIQNLPSRGRNLLGSMKPA